MSSMPICGIYTIMNTLNNKIYIGYSNDIYRRFREHRSILNRGISTNKSLQNAWNKYGISVFVFELLEECEEKLLPSQENYWCNILNTHNRKYGFNERATNPDDVQVLSLNTRQKIGNTRRTTVKQNKKQIKLKLLVGRKPLKNRDTKVPKYKRSTISHFLKPVIQFSLEGIFIKEWEGIIVAANTVGINYMGISQCCKNKCLSAGGFVWKYKSDYVSGTTIIVAKRLKEIREVFQYDLADNIVANFKNMNDAARMLNISHSAIRNSIVLNKPTSGFKFTNCQKIKQYELL